MPAVQDQDNPEGTVLQPVAEAKPAKLDPDADIEPSAGGAQETNTAISSDQPAVEAPPGFQQPVDSTPAHHPSGMTYPVIVGVENISPDVATSFVCIPLNLGEHVKTHEKTFLRF